MEPIKLHKQGNSSVIIIPDNIIKTTGWEDGTLLDVINTDDVLQIRKKKIKEDLIAERCFGSSQVSVKEVTSVKSIRYNSGLNHLIDELYFPARRVFFLCLDYYSNNRFEPGKSVPIRADKYAELVGIDRTVAYKQMKDAADFFSKNTTLISRCDYIFNEGLLRVELSPDVINYVTAVDGRKYKFTSVSYQSALKLSGKYSWSLYQLIKYHISGNAKSFCISVNELITELNALVNLDFKDYKRTVIGRAINEITEKTEIKSIQCVNAERRGRKVSKVRFEIEMR